ncbi:hypothetical protein MHYP_G00292260 [Metynnis hypsauchen]
MLLWPAVMHPAVHVRTHAAVVVFLVLQWNVPSDGLLDGDVHHLSCVSTENTVTCSLAKADLQGSQKMQLEVVAEQTVEIRSLGNSSGGFSPCSWAQRHNCGLVHNPRPCVRRVHGNPDTAALKLELQASLRKGVGIFKKELQDTLGNVLSTIQLDLQAVKTQLAHDKAANDATMSKIKSTVGEMEHVLTECSDDIAMMKTTVKSLTASVAKLENKCENLESRSRRNNIRILGVLEGPDSCTAAAVAAILKEAFGLVKEPLLDRSHRTLQPKPKPGDRPRVIVCRFHYHSDCVDILPRTRKLRQIKVRDLIISIFPDYTAKYTALEFMDSVA